MFVTDLRERNERLISKKLINRDIKGLGNLIEKVFVVSAPAIQKLIKINSR